MNYINDFIIKFKKRFYNKSENQNINFTWPLPYFSFRTLIKIIV